MHLPLIIDMVRVNWSCSFSSEHVNMSMMMMLSSISPLHLHRAGQFSNNTS